MGVPMKVSYGEWDEVLALGKPGHPLQAQIVSLMTKLRSQDQTDLLSKLWDRVIHDPLAKRYANALGRTKRNTEPWHAMGEQKIATLGLLETRRPGSRVRCDIPGVVSDADLIGFVLLFDFAVPYFWLDTTAKLAWHTPLPRHTIARGIMPYPVMFWSFQGHCPATTDDGRRAQVDWLFLQDCGEGMNVLMPLTFEDGTASIEGASIPYGRTWPDDFPGRLREGAAWILRGLAFIASPFVRSEPHRLPRPVRRDMQKAGLLDKAKPEPVAYAVVLRREAQEAVKRQAEEEQELTERKHHWWVSGHFRAQWYPSEKAHKVIWIAPHIKGNLDAPLLNKVYAVVR